MLLGRRTPAQLTLIDLANSEESRAMSATACEFDPPLDPGIVDAVLALRSGGIETFESCEGGAGHAYPEPTVRFYGTRADGFMALAVAMHAGIVVTALRRVWPILDSEPTGPWWEITVATVPTTDH